MAIAAAVEAGGRALAALRRAARGTLGDAEAGRERVVEAYTRTDAHHLSLQNYLYERTHLEREIAMCADFPTPELDALPLVGAEAVVGEVDGSDEVAVMRARLGRERELRLALAAQVEADKAALAALRARNAEKARLLEALPGAVAALELASVPLQAAFGRQPSPAVAARVAAVGTLPPPLHALYAALEAAAMLETLAPTYALPDASADAPAAPVHSRIILDVVPANVDAPLAAGAPAAAGAAAASALPVGPDLTTIAVPVESSRARAYAAAVGAAILPAPPPRSGGEGAASGMKRARSSDGGSSDDGSGGTGSTGSGGSGQQWVTARDVWRPHAQALVAALFLPALTTEAVGLPLAGSGGATALPLLPAAVRLQYYPLLDVTTVAPEPAAAVLAVGSAGGVAAADAAAAGGIRVPLPTWMLHNLAAVPKCGGLAGGGGAVASAPDVGAAVAQWTALQARGRALATANGAGAPPPPSPVPRWVGGKPYAWLQGVAGTRAPSDALYCAGASLPLRTMLSLLRLRLVASGALQAQVRALATYVARPPQPASALVRVPTPAALAARIAAATSAADAATSASLPASPPAVATTAALFSHAAPLLSAAAGSIGEGAPAASFVSFEDVTAVVDFTATAAATAAAGSSAASAPPKCAIHAYFPKEGFASVVLRVFRAVYAVPAAAPGCRTYVQALIAIPLEFPAVPPRVAVHVLAHVPRGAALPTVPLPASWEAAEAAQAPAIDAGVAAAATAAASAGPGASAEEAAASVKAVVRALGLAVTAGACLCADSPTALLWALPAQLAVLQALLPALLPAAQAGRLAAAAPDVAAALAAWEPAALAAAARTTRPLPPAHQAADHDWSPPSRLVVVAPRAADDVRNPTSWPAALAWL